MQPIQRIAGQIHQRGDVSLWQNCLVWQVTDQEKFPCCWIDRHLTLEAMAPVFCAAVKGICPRERAVTKERPQQISAFSAVRCLNPRG
jgi:hypothetical protein